MLNGTLTKLNPTAIKHTKKQITFIITQLHNNFVSTAKFALQTNAHLDERYIY